MIMSTVPPLPPPPAPRRPPLPFSPPTGNSLHITSMNLEPLHNISRTVHPNVACIAPCPNVAYITAQRGSVRRRHLRYKLSMPTSRNFKSQLSSFARRIIEYAPVLSSGRTKLCTRMFTHATPQVVHTSVVCSEHVHVGQL